MTLTAVSHTKHRNFLVPPTIGRENIPVEDFLALNPVHIQRDITWRKKSVERLLKKGLVDTHVIVSIGEASRDIPSIGLKKGDRVIINANTRNAIWKDWMGTADEQLIPQFVYADIFSVSSEKEIENLYYSFDSQDAVEKTPHKITGIYKKLGMNPQTGFIAKGGIKKALEYAAAGKDNLVYASLTELIAEFKDAIETLDSLCPNKNVFDVTLTCASLMLLNKYPNNEHLLEGLKRVNNQERDAGSPKTGYPPLTFFMNEWDMNKIFHKRGTSGTDMPPQLNFALCCFDKYMNNESNMKQYHSRKSYYDTWWDAEDE